VLSGTPTQNGSFPIVVTVTDSNGCTGTGATYNLTINCQTITVTNPVGNVGTRNAPFSATFTQTGAQGSATFTTASTLPTGITLATNGVLSGTTLQTGTFPIVVTVTDSNGCTGTGATYNLTINCQTITVTNPATTTGTVASPFSQTFTQTGAIGGATFTTASTLPTGLSLSAAGVLSGTPTQSGSFPIVVTVTDGGSCIGTGATYTLVIACNVISVTNPATNIGTAGSAFSQTFTQTGGNGTITWSETGALPAGITLNTSTGVLSGVTSATGTFPIAVTATDGNGCVGTGATYNLTINCQTITVTNPGVNTVQAGVAFNQTFTVTGILGTVTWSETGALPSGITLNSSSGVLSGTTNAIGSYPITVKATDTNLCFGTSSYTLTVTCPTITVTRTGGGSFPAATFNTVYAGQSVTASGGGGSYSFAVTAGTFPTGLSLASGGGITGTPTATGTFNFTVTATDTASLCTGTQSFSIAVNPSAGGDSYSNLVNNTQAVVTGGTTTSPATPFVGLSGTIIANDLPAGGVAAVAGTFATTQGGSVTIAADGTFIYTPPVTATALASDTFNYTVASDTGGTGTPATNTGTVTLNLAGRVWYVKNNGAAGNGQSQSPFNSLAAAQTASAAGDIIYVYNGDGLTTGQTAGITLKNNQQLIGEGVALVVNTVTLKAAGTKPQITNTAGDGVTLANGNTLKGFTVTGTSSNGINGTNTNGLTVDTVTATAAGAGASSLVLTTPSNNVTITNTTLSNSPLCLTINGGTANFVMNNTNTITANAGQRSINFANLGATSVTAIGAAITDNGVGMAVTNSVNGAAISFTGTQTLGTTTNPAVTLGPNGATSVITFSGTLAITTSTGNGFSATGGGTLNVTGTANVTTGAATTGVNINGVTAGASGVTFTTVNTTGATTGVSLTSLGNGNVTINGGTISGGTTGLSLSTLGTSTVTLGANAQTLTFTGSTTAISGTTFGTLAVAAGSTVNVSGVTALNLATGAVTGTFANVSSTGGTNGVTLSAVTGAWGATAGTLTGASGATFNATGTSTGTVSWAGAITQANGANVVTISGSHTGTINFSGNVQTSGTSTGVSISGSSGTYNFTGATNTIAGSGGGITIGNGATESGTITFGSGTSITSTAAGAVFNINGPVATVSANVTYSGTISKSGTSGVVLNISNYSGTLLMNGTSIVGLFNGSGSSTSTLSNITGSVTINNLSLTSGFNTFSGTLLGISGTNTGSTITFNHLVLSANGSGHTGAGLVDSGTGGTVTVTATGGASTFDTGGAALSLNGQAMGASTIGTLTCTGAAAAANGTCVSLTSVSGSLTISGGSITGGGAAAFLVSGGTPTISYAGTITQNTAAQRAVDLQTRTGGTITFSGLITSSGGAGVFMNNAAGGSTTVFSGGMTLSTGTSDAFTATGGGVVNVSGTNNITTTSGKGINWATDTSAATVTFNNVTSSTGAAVTITSSGATNFTLNDVTSTTGTAVAITTATGAFTFHAINANGAATGISVTGASGSFTVNGTSTTSGTGGTLQNCTAKGADIRTSSNITLKNMNFTNNATGNLGVATTCGDALNGTNGPTNCNANISLLTITTATLNNVTATGSKQIGIDVNGGTNLTLTNVTATGNGNEVEEDGVQIVNLLGTLAISGGTYKDNAANEFEVQNGVAGTLTITADSATFSNTAYPTGVTTPSNTTANGGLFLATHGASGSIINPTVTNCIFDRIYTQAFRADMAGNTGMTILFGPASGAGNGNTVSNAGGGAIITGTNTGTVNFTIRNNGFTNNPAVQPDTNSGGVISARKSSPANGSWTGTIQNNTVGTNGVAKSGCVIAGCIGINFDTSNASGNYTTTITGNSVFRTSGDGINVHGGGGSDSSVIRTTIQTNTLGDPEPNGQGAGGQTQGNAIFVEAGTVAGDTTTVKAQIDTNTASGQWSTAFNLSAIRVRQRFATTTFCLTNYNPATNYGGGAGTNTSVSAFLTSANPASTAPVGYTVATATQTGGTITGPSCP
ncbi:MAG: hypothetical protein QOI24_907, partial [Acidobacteriota bacterium]|nr:hypothetical protein [Acidobacteriota bacterium]